MRTSGYFTILKYLTGLNFKVGMDPLRWVEQAVGFDKGRLAGGCEIVVLSGHESLSPDEFAEQPLR